MFCARRFIRLPGRRGFWWVLAALLAGLLAGCKPPPKVVRGQYPLPQDVDVDNCKPGKYGSTFVLVDLDEPKTFNPLVPTDDQGSDMAQNYFLSPLMTLDPMSGQPQGALAKSWEIAPDNKTYTFHLRRGVKWSDGEPLTADDVIFTFDCIFAMTTDPQTGKPTPRYPERWLDEFTFDGKPLTYRKIDDYTVEFYTPAVYSPFLTDMMYVYILPKHILGASMLDGTLLKRWSLQTGIDHPEELVGTGMFTIKSYRPADSLVYAANPHYWRADTTGQRLPYIDFFIIKYVSTFEAEMMWFSTGQSEAAWNPGVPGPDLSWVSRNAQTYDYRIINMGTLPDIISVAFDLKPGVDKNGQPYVTPYKLAWFSDKRFRQAVMYAINREGIIQGVYFGRAQVQKSIINQGNPHWFNPNVQQYSYDPDKARALLREMGFTWDAAGNLIDKDGHPVEFELLLAEGSRRVVDIGNILKQNLQAIGIDLKITFVDFTVMLQKEMNTHDFEMVEFNWGDPSGEVDPSGNKSLFRSSGEDHLWNPGQTTPATPWEKQIDDLMDEQERSFDYPTRKRIFGQIQDIFADELPMIYLIAPNQYQGIKNKWHNVQTPPSGFIIWNMDELWADPTGKSD
jgi:peptide/nickel transport system substrate-binding protein